ncbi:MAG: indole-3-glycerol phosphate synthase TrpC [Albidovulum sp.]|nr:indole-3-glycerol phosphate synthase TrpC [Albidovulum sp.]
MNSILERIAAYKTEEVRTRSDALPLSELESLARDAPPTRGFAERLIDRSRTGFGIIAEIKKASPSKGLIRESFSPSEIAAEYEAGGAACISVLTDSPSFQGSPDHLDEARNSASLPLIRKDFMLDPYQIFESRSIGADCVLIILGMVDDVLAHELESTAFDLGMDALIEVHDEAELDRAMKLRSPLIGINNRDLRTFRVDIETTVRLVPRIPPGRTIVSESGIWNSAHLAELSESGVRCFLIGESLMRQTDIAVALRELLACEGIGNSIENDSKRHSGQNHGRRTA